MIISDTGSSFEQLEEGLHPAVSILIASIGTHRTPFKNEDGTDKVLKKMIVQWETAKGLIAKEYTVSLNEKANLRKDLESWRGKKFTETELKGFDMKTLLGVPCTVQVMHNDNGYAIVTAVLPKTGEFKHTKTPVLFDIDETEGDAYDRLPNWVQKKVDQSFERQEKVGGTFTLKDIPERVSNSDEEINLDEIPF
jgi:hypothetical protein